MVALRASSTLVEPASFVAHAQVISYELRGEKCWFAMFISPLEQPDSLDEGPNTDPYIVYRLFSDFKYFISYLTQECARYEQRTPRLTSRKRILSSKTAHAGRVVHDLNEFLTPVLALPATIRSSICFSEFFGLWECDLTDPLPTTPISVDFSKATIPTVSTVQEAFEATEFETASVSTATFGPLHRSNTVGPCTTSNRSEPPLKVAPWNVRHMTDREKAVWRTKRNSLIRFNSCRSHGRGNAVVIAPFVRVKVILNSDNIINIMVARNIAYDDLRKRIFEKFCENPAFNPEDFESVVLAYKRENSLIIIASNDDLRSVLVDEINKYTMYLPSAKLLDEFFWMREVAEVHKSATEQETSPADRDSGYISYRTLSNESLRERFLYDSAHPMHKSLSLQRQNSTSLRRQNSLAAIRNAPLQNSHLRRQKTLASLHQKTVIASLQHEVNEAPHGMTDRPETNGRSTLQEPSSATVSFRLDSTESATPSKSVVFRLKVALDSESCVVIPVQNTVTCPELKALIFKAFLQAGYSEERLESLQLIYRTMDSHFLTVENEQDVRSLISIVRLDDGSRGVQSLSLYLFPRGLFSSLRRGGILLDIPLDMICVS
ncbi:hypothetical protein K493DRAFT_300643 [Basidiobolus meristosporus CBS 931.73]|uniref:PX domain-containing protein n=1 Tax=Basidiobolus meristosporus CBS 931.73 TaxID=1314790 RepID=A0A1Y1YGB3_9FUNG|nr:hypothetical protein K493DRAFT_300643 [Basidiobolus meristosporus CBS 931.73]|eukprot:ORX96988.1 hypothetical protein K493DRAFT_300643 [Basidiobolus meristosporus CBS 931.73]